VNFSIKGIKCSEARGKTKERDLKGFRQRKQRSLQRVTLLFNSEESHLGTEN